MKYLLTVQTNGRPAYLERALQAAADFLKPAPSAVHIVDDGGRTDPELVERIGRDHGWTVQLEPTPGIGMCAAYAHCWRAAAESEYEWVFHNEDDQLILRPVNLNQFATVMATNPHLAQMALVRAPWGAEVAYGGYIPATPGWYERHENTHGQWIETTRNWSTSPALIRTETLRLISPDAVAPANCETTIGPLLRDRNGATRFGLWGWGEAWMSHIGINRAPGSRGY